MRYEFWYFNLAYLKAHDSTFQQRFCKALANDDYFVSSEGKKIGSSNDKNDVSLYISIILPNGKSETDYVLTWDSLNNVWL